MKLYKQIQKNIVDGVYPYNTKLPSKRNMASESGVSVISVEHAYDLLRDEYDIQIEFGDIGNILAYISIGDRIQEIERLVGALEDIKRLWSKPTSKQHNAEYIPPIVAATPQKAFYAEKELIPIRETAGRICGEFVMCYPPGIPILAPGEMITNEIIDYTLYAKEKGCSMQGPEDGSLEKLNVLIE